MIPFLSTTKTSVWPLRPNCAEAATAAPGSKRPARPIAPGPPHLPAFTTHRTFRVPLTSTQKTSVCPLIPNCGDTAIGAPGGKTPGPEMATGPFHLPAPTTQATLSAPRLSTQNTSVWLATPCCAMHARLAPGGKRPFGPIAPGPPQAPPPTTQATLSAPLLSMQNTS